MLTSNTKRVALEQLVFGGTGRETVVAWDQVRVKVRRRLAKRDRIDAQRACQLLEFLLDVPNGQTEVDSLIGVELRRALDVALTVEHQPPWQRRGCAVSAQPSGVFPDRVWSTRRHH